MDRETFDALTRLLAETPSRRQALGALLGATLRSVVGSAAAEPGRKKRGNGGAQGTERSKRRGRAGADHKGRGRGEGEERRDRKRRRDRRPGRGQAAAGCCSGGNCTPGPGKNLAKCCYQGQNLVGQNFKGANLGGASFKGATVTTANFAGANLDKTCFVDANLTGPGFGSANTGTAIFCRTTMPDGTTNDSGCNKGTACCPTCDDEHPCDGAQHCCPDGTCKECCTNSQCPSGVCCNGRCCPQGQTCQNGQCACLPNCQGRECGPDGCGGQCLPGCPNGEICNAQGQCICNSRSCPNGCCDTAAGPCLPGSTPQHCGGNGAICVACPTGQTCVGGRCVCNATSCPNGCCSNGPGNPGNCLAGNTNQNCGTGGELCDPCTGQEHCVAGDCVCQSNCAGKECGPDGCGGQCPPGCPTGETCTQQSRCSCTAQSCPNGQVCCDSRCRNGDCCADRDCGASGNICQDFTCQCGGNPACSGATPDCCGSPGTCTATDSDPANCGACGKACGDCESCEDGTCVSPCGPEEVCCDGGCTAAAWSNLTIFGRSGSGASQFLAPSGVAAAADQKTIWVADTSNDRISVWTESGGVWSNQTTFGSTGSELGQLNEPAGVAVSANGQTVWVADSDNDRVSVWTESGGIWTNQTTFGSFGSGPDEFSTPSGVVVSADETTVWVADTLNDRISVWRDSGGSWNNLTTFGSTGSDLGELDGPVAVAVSADGQTVWVADSDNDRISVWVESGGIWSNPTTFGSFGSRPSQFTGLHGVAVAADEQTVWVADAFNSRISVWRESGGVWSNLTTFGSLGGGLGDFVWPLGVAVSADGQAVWAIDGALGRISIWAVGCPQTQDWTGRRRAGMTPVRKETAVNRNRIDALSRILAETGSRRTVIGSLLAAVGMGVPAHTSAKTRSRRTGRRRLHAEAQPRLGQCPYPWQCRRIDIPSAAHE